MRSNATETNHGFILLEEQAIDLTVYESKIDFCFQTLVPKSWVCCVLLGN